MGIFRKATNRNPEFIATITAGASTYNLSDYTTATRVSLTRQDWQKRAFEIYDAEGHLFYATNYIGGALARIRLVAATKPKTHDTLEQPMILKSGPVADAINEIKSSVGGQSGFLRQLGRNVFLTGEAWVIASKTNLPDGSSSVGWDAVSVDELVVDGKNFKRRRLPGAQPEALPEGTSSWRIWKEHPRYSELADSGTRSCMELLEKVIILNRAEKAVARQQIAGAGILAIPQELVPPGWQNQMNTADPMQANPAWQALAEDMTAPFHDENAPSAVVPTVLIGPGDVIGKMKYEPMNRTFDSVGAQSSIKNAVDQIANTLELPKEILLGVGEATHWTAWAIREDVFQAHIQPLIELICDGLTRRFLVSALARFSDAELKAAGIDDRNDVIVWYDPSQLIIQPDKGDKMLGLHDRLIVTNDAVAEEIGVRKEDRLDPESMEYKQRVGVKMADAKMAITGKPTEPPAPPAGGMGGAGAGAGGAGPKGINPGRGKSPQGPRAAPPKLPSERRAVRGLPQDSVTASAMYEPGAELVRFDVGQLKLFRELAERHVKKSLRSITAAASADDFIDPSYLEEFANLAYASWSDATGLVTSLFGELPNPIYSSTIDAAVKSATNYYLDLIKATINDRGFGREPIYGEFVKGDIVQFGDVRPLLTHLGGGSVEVQVQTGGIATGTSMREWLRSNGIDAEHKIWLYGYEQPRRTFNGHLQLDGLVFDSWDDEALTIAPQDAWLRTPRYFVGDHFGCGCMVGPYIPNFGDPYELNLTE